MTKPTNEDKITRFVAFEKTSDKHIVPLKADGSLDVEFINKLPITEYIKVIPKLTLKQYRYYNSQRPLCEAHQKPKVIRVDYTIEDEIKRGTGVDFRAYLRDWESEWT